VEDIVHATTTLLASLVTQAPPKDRADEAAKAKQRSQQRFGNS
ncbi:MAG: hypothetical protein RJA70_3259, partial [Pseudomonadota bacterium]